MYKWVLFSYRSFAIWKRLLLTGTGSCRSVKKIIILIACSPKIKIALNALKHKINKDFFLKRFLVGFFSSRICSKSDNVNFCGQSYFSTWFFFTPQIICCLKVLANIWLTPSLKNWRENRAVWRRWGRSQTYCSSIKAVSWELISKVKEG